MGVPDSHDGLIGNGQCCFVVDVCFHSCKVLTANYYENTSVSRDVQLTLKGKSVTCYPLPDKIEGDRSR